MWVQLREGTYSASFDTLWFVRGLQGDTSPLVVGADSIPHTKGAPLSPSALSAAPGGAIKYDAAAADMWSLGVVL